MDIERDFGGLLRGDLPRRNVCQKLSAYTDRVFLVVDPPVALGVLDGTAGVVRGQTVTNQFGEASRIALGFDASRMYAAVLESPSWKRDWRQGYGRFTLRDGVEECWRDALELVVKPPMRITMGIGRQLRRALSSLSVSGWRSADGSDSTVVYLRHAWLMRRGGEDLSIEGLSRLGLVLFDGGARQFGDWTRRMVQASGLGCRPLLRECWQETRRLASVICVAPRRVEGLRFATPREVPEAR